MGMGGNPDRDLHALGSRERESCVVIGTFCVGLTQDIRPAFPSDSRVYRIRILQRGTML